LIKIRRFKTSKKKKFPVKFPMKKLDGAASESSAASTELAATSDEFNKMVEKIESQVSKFKSE